MRSLISLLVIVLIVFMLSKLLLSSAPVGERAGGGDTTNRTSDQVRNRVNEATEGYQQSLEKSMQDAGVDEQ